MDVGGWLRSLGLGQYQTLFHASDIDADILPELTDVDLEKLGVSLGHRKRLLRAISALAAAEASAAPPASTGAERRQLTVMFCDLVGSTALSTRLDPEDMREIIGAYHRAVAEIVARSGGFVSRYMGDGVLVYFGYPQAHENDAERAVRAGLSAIDAVGRLHVNSAKLQARVGIATGLVVVGDLVGEGPAQEQSVVGETPNLAARLQTLAEPNTVVIAASTRRLVGNLFEYRDLGAVEVKGIAAPVPAWQVLRPSAVASRFEALHGSMLGPLVGRDEEIDLLLRRWARAKAGDGQVVLISGEPGIGKSRIAAALEERLPADPHLRLRYSCSPYHQDSALFPFVDLLGREAGFAHEDPPALKLEKLEALLALAATPDEDVALLADLLSLPGSERHSLPNLTPQRKKERTLTALIRRLEAVARQQPLVMVFEDAHWIDPTSRDWLDLAVERVRSLRVLLVITFRPEFQSPWTGQPQVAMLALNRLDRYDRTALIEQIAGSRALPDEVVKQIGDRTDGVPLFIEELTKSVLESGVPAVGIPATLQDTLMARLDRTPEVKEIAQTAACIGREFDFALLAAISQQPEAELISGLDRLGVAELVFRRGFGVGMRYVFKHALVRDAAYESLLKSRRQAIHTRLVAALEAGVGERSPEILARHSELAGMTDRAIEEYRHAGDAAAKRPAYAEAIASYEAALRLLVTLEEGRGRDECTLATEIARAQTLMASSGYGAAETQAAFSRARPLAEKVGEPRSLFHIEYGQWAASNVRGDLQDSLARGRRALAGCAPDDPDDIRSLAHRMVGTPLAMMGRFAESVGHFQESVALYSPERHADHPRRFGMDTRAANLIYLAIARWCLGAVDAALSDMRACLEISRQADGALARALGLGYAAMLQSWIDPAGAGDLVDELFDLCVRDGVPFWASLGHGLRAGVRMGRGDHLGALDDAALGRDLADRSGAQGTQPQWLGFAARSQIALKRFDAAEATLRDLQTMKVDIRWTQSDTDAIEGDLMLARGNAAAAEACWRRAIDVARGQGAASWELRAVIRLARLLAGRGESDKAKTPLAAAYARIDGGRATPDVVAAAALLRELETSR
jgi:class 3 adenylate cyclase/tetratricopeptide (TPR) repeat protein